MDGPTGCFDSLIIHIDAVRKVVEDDFEGLLKKENLKFLNYEYYPEIFYTKWINTKYSGDADKMFSWAVCSLFHLDALEEGRIKSEEKQKSYQRKIDRTREKFEDGNASILFYYYKPHKGYNVELLKTKLYEFVDFLTSKYKKQFILSLLTYKDSNQKSVKFLEDEKIHHTIFETDNNWIGPDENWSGKSDNDLFDQYALSIKNYINKYNYV